MKKNLAICTWADGYVVTDNLGCKATTFAEIAQPDELIYTVIQNTYSCSTGLTTVIVSVNGGTPYDNGTNLYHGFPSGWSQSSSNHNEYINASVNSIQTFTIHDNNNCQLVINITPVTVNNVQVNFSHIDADCAGNLGSATAIPSNGISPYTYSWSNALGTSATVTGLISGIYTCTVTDAGGCSNSGTVQILGNTLNVVLNSTPILCFGGTSTVTISATGGTAPYAGTGSFRTRGPPES